MSYKSFTGKEKLEKSNTCRAHARKIISISWQVLDDTWTKTPRHTQHIVDEFVQKTAQQFIYITTYYYESYISSISQLYCA